MDRKFSGGPWYVSFECSTVIVAEDSVYGVGVADCSLGSDDSECRTQEECEANSRLIAAAPEMLEALKRVAYNDDRPLGRDFLIGHIDMERVKAAIAKATEGDCR